jgi:peptidoglycan hydrolase-like protein with peptidoglycan-binding domain
MKLSHLLIAGATAVSFSAIAADEQKDKQPQAQSSQSQSSQSQSASGGSTQSSSQQQAGQDQDTVKQVQEKLSAAGHQVQADGIMGPKTQAALKEYQQSKGLDASGQLDQKTMAALGVGEGATASTGGSASTGSSSDKSSSGSASGGASAEPKSESKEKSQ